MCGSLSGTNLSRLPRPAPRRFTPLVTKSKKCPKFTRFVATFLAVTQIASTAKYWGQNLWRKTTGNIIGYFLNPTTKYGWHSPRIAAAAAAGHTPKDLKEESN